MRDVDWWKPLFNFAYLKQKLCTYFKVLLMLLHKQGAGLDNLKSYDIDWSCLVPLISHKGM
jgi:hypothetical protein